LVNGFSFLAAEAGCCKVQQTYETTSPAPLGISTYENQLIKTAWPSREWEGHAQPDTGVSADRFCLGRT
ncbi:MAG: hypothetical protein KDC32_23060, partial [Saprospiraceae bacterium]|nr:hypothetical protein [Saprospiraceae bacterium]